MKRKLALWMYDTAIRLEPAILIGINQIVEQQILEMQARVLLAHEEQVRQIAFNN